jgi:hypothetical protein
LKRQIIEQTKVYYFSASWREGGEDAIFALLDRYQLRHHWSGGDVNQPKSGESQDIFYVCFYF